MGAQQNLMMHERVLGAYPGKALSISSAGAETAQTGFGLELDIIDGFDFTAAFPFSSDVFSLRENGLLAGIVEEEDRGNGLDCGALTIASVFCAGLEAVLVPFCHNSASTQTHDP